MPNVGSWNGRWSGANKQYFVIRSYTGERRKRILEIFNGKNECGFYYNFGDGWGASVHMEIINAQEGRKRRKASAGFCGYEWMIDSIIKHGEILSKEPENA